MHAYAHAHVPSQWSFRAGDFYLMEYTAGPPLQHPHCGTFTAEVECDAYALTFRGDQGQGPDVLQTSSAGR